MKIPASNKKLILRLCAMPVSMAVLFLLGYWYHPEQGLRVYLAGLFSMKIPMAIIIALLLYIELYILADTCSFELDENGIWCYPKLGKARYARWEEFAYVGLMLQKCPKYNRLVLVCSQTKPRIKRSYHDAYTCDKNAFVIPYSPESRAAVKACCPSFSVRFEKFINRRRLS